MEIVRLPKMPRGATLARLTISESHGGRVATTFSIEGAMSGSTEKGDYDTPEAAVAAATAAAQQRRASFLIIEDRS